VNPNELPSYPAAGPEGGNQSNTRLLLIALGVVVVIIIIAIMVFLKPHQSGSNTGGKLSVTGTNPDTTAVATNSDSLAISFSEPLQSGSAQVSSDPKIITGSSISGDTLTLKFPPKTLKSGSRYTITLNSIKSTSGSELTNDQLSFIPSIQEPTTSGEDSLLNVGLSNDQVHNIVMGIAQFDPYAKEEDFNSSTIKHFRLNPSDAWSPWAVSVTVAVDGANYNVVSSYFDTQHVKVQVLDPATGQQLFTTGDPGSI